VRWAQQFQKSVGWMQLQIDPTNGHERRLPGAEAFQDGRQQHLRALLCVHAENPEFVTEQLHQSSGTPESRSLIC
jgi:hypothetical protein